MTRLFNASEHRPDLEEHFDAVQEKPVTDHEIRLQQCLDTRMLQWHYRLMFGIHWHSIGEVFFIKGHRSRNVKPKKN